MKFAFHLWGNKALEFYSLDGHPKAIFFESNWIPRKVSGELGVILEDGDMPKWNGLKAVKYKDNRWDVPEDMFTVFYGDVRKIQRNRRIPIACDIMDESFWYYFDVLKMAGLFTFSVNTTYCDPIVYLSTLKVISKTADAICYGDLL